LSSDQPHVSTPSTLDTGGDSIARGLLAGGAARVVSVVSTEITREAAARHGTNGLASVALGRASTAGLLLATLTKDDERVTLQLLGTGPLGSLTVDAHSNGRVRAFVKNPLASAAEALPRAGERVSVAAGLGHEGQVIVVRDVGLREPFRGQTAFASGEVDADVERYLIESEQIDSALACEVVLDAQGDVVFAGGVMVQALPGTEGSAWVEAARTRANSGALFRAVAMGMNGETPTPESLAESLTLGREDGSPDPTMDRSEAPLWLERRPVFFECPCSKERAAATLGLLDEAELTHMLATNEQGQVICNFCRRTYVFAAEELDAIRADVRRKTESRS